MTRVLLATLTVLGCASQRAAAPASGDDEESTSSESAAPPPTAEQQRAQRRDQDDLSTAFEHEKAAAPARPVLATAASPAAPTIDRHKQLREQIERARTSLARKEIETADSDAAEAVRLSEGLTTDERRQAWALAFSVKVAMGEGAAAQDVALAWLRGCGPEHLEACRVAAVSALGAVAKVKGANATAVHSLATDLQKAEACVAKVEHSAKTDPCLAAAERLAAQKRDPLQLARIGLARAHAEKSEAKRTALFEKAEAKCALPQCLGLRRKALKALGAAAMASDDTEAALRYAVREEQLYAATLEPDQRLYARTDDVDKLCAQYDAQVGPGACRRLEKQLTGRWSFRDYSQVRAGEGLKPERVREVNEHFAPLLQECLEAQAKRLVPPDAVRYEVSWLVTNDGRVGEAHLRRDMDNTELAQCLRAQFITWRYPRYDGEYQHVEQAFTVSAAVRRSR